MNSTLRLLLLILVLNAVRYLVAGPIEQFTVLPPLFQSMAESPTYFNMDFSSADMLTSFIYNGLMWAVTVVVFHLIHSNLTGGWWSRSFQSFGLMFLFFASVSAIYMNHYAHPPAFYIYSILDGVIAFGTVAAANALLYPRIVRPAELPPARVVAA